MIGPRSARGASVADLERVYREQFRRLVRCAGAIVGDADLARDAVQEAFARAVRRRSTFRGEGQLEAWLWRVVINTARDHSRAAAHALPEPGGEGALDLHRDRDRAEVVRVRVAIARLPERQRLVLFLRYYADLDYEAVAAVLGIRPGTVGAALSRAHDSLRYQLEEVGSEL